MSDEPKPRGKSSGKPKPELTKLKDLWRDSLTEDAKGFWRSRFASSDYTQVQNRADLRTKLKINLTEDSQLTNFRAWLNEQDELNAEADRQAQEEKQLREEHPDWTDEHLREAVISGAYRRALSQGDFKLGLATVKQDVSMKSLEFDKEKFKEAMRSKLEAGLAELAQHIKGNPKAQAAYAAFKSTISDSTK